MEQNLKFNLCKSSWTKSDIKPFENYLNSIKSTKEKCEWEKRIVNTSLDCLALGMQKIKKIINEIYKGNYLSFLDIMPWNNHAETLICGGLISKIKDFDTVSHYLEIYSQKCENWASCDTLKFGINNTNKAQYFNLSKQYIKSSKPFVRRIGFLVLFSLIKYDEYVDEIITQVLSSSNETEYYVNMCVAWLVCELYIKRKTQALALLKSKQLNTFVQNKAISKCCDSFRVSAEDKQFLKTLKK